MLIFDGRDPCVLADLVIDGIPDDFVDLRTPGLVIGLPSQIEAQSVLMQHRRKQVTID